MQPVPQTVRRLVFYRLSVDLIPPFVEDGCTPGEVPAPMDLLRVPVPVSRRQSKAARGSETGPVRFLRQRSSRWDTLLIARGTSEWVLATVILLPSWAMDRRTTSNNDSSCRLAERTQCAGLAHSLPGYRCFFHQFLVSFARPHAFLCA